MKYFKSVIIPAVAILSLGGCTPQREDRLNPSGKFVTVPQGQQFCNDNPEDSLCQR